MASFVHVTGFGKFGNYTENSTETVCNTLREAAAASEDYDAIEDPLLAKFAWGFPLFRLTGSTVFQVSVADVDRKLSAVFEELHTVSRKRSEKAVYPEVKAQKCRHLLAEYEPALEKDRSAGFPQLVVLHLGVCKDKSFRIEALARNEKSFRIPDNDQRIETQQPITCEKPLEHGNFTKLPCEALVAGLKKLRHRVKLSTDAGTYLCNYLYYQSLARVEPSSSEASLFLHVPDDASDDEVFRVVCDLMLLLTSPEYLHEASSSDVEEWPLTKLKRFMLMRRFHEIAVPRRARQHDCEEIRLMLGGYKYCTMDPRLCSAQDLAAKDPIGGITRRKDANAFARRGFRLDYAFNVFVGKGWYANYDVTILDTNNVIFGDHIVLGPHVCISCAVHDFCRKDRRKAYLYSVPVFIGDYVWVQGNATVQPGVRIGSGAVIEAGAVVCEDVPAGYTCCGVPGKLLPLRETSWIRSFGAVNGPFLICGDSDADSSPSHDNASSCPDP